MTNTSKCPSCSITKKGTTLYKCNRCGTISCSECLVKEIPKIYFLGEKYGITNPVKEVEASMGKKIPQPYRIRCNNCWFTELTQNPNKVIDDNFIEVGRIN